MAEFPATGGILTSWQIYSVKFLIYVSYYDYFIAFCEITFLILFTVFIIQEGKKMKEFKFAYFKRIWNWLELLLLVVSIYSNVWLKEFTYEPINKRCKKQKFLFIGIYFKSFKYQIIKWTVIVHTDGVLPKGKSLFPPPWFDSWQDQGKPRGIGNSIGIMI